METDTKEFYSFYEWDKIKVFDILFRCKGNVLTILRHRGFDVDDEEYEQYVYSDYDEFKKKRDRCLRKIKREGKHKIEPRKYFSGFYYGNNKAIYTAFVTQEGSSVSKKAIDDIIRVVEREDGNVTHTMIISDIPIYKSATDKYSETAHTFEVYQTSNMCLNRLDHVLSPKVQVLTKEEKKTFLKEGVPASKLPHYERFQRADAEISEPLLQHFQYPIGTIVKITRENNYTKQTIGESLYWRTV